jgi:ribosome-associated protein
MHCLYNQTTSNNFKPPQTISNNSQTNIMQPDIIISELQFRTARSGGKGGQNVNKVETKVEARWPVMSSAALTDAEKALVMEKLANDISTEGELIVTNQTDRSQLGNKNKAIQKLLAKVKKALHVPKKRKAVAVPQSVIEARAQEKQHRSTVKANRQKVNLSRLPEPD